MARIHKVISGMLYAPLNGQKVKEGRLRSIFIVVCHRPTALAIYVLISTDLAPGPQSKQRIAQNATMMWLACAASLAPRYCPGAHPWEAMILAPKELVSRAHAVLFGSCDSLFRLFGPARPMVAVECLYMRSELFYNSVAGCGQDFCPAALRVCVNYGFAGWTRAKTLGRKPALAGCRCVFAIAD
ncbi:hypothetical protein M8818_001685 [Zalaria obscura]|uniref:Uncharacterized protein n=1 Tax=Zalaria obscura TaxID=2024903 RepID=A0ACC3SJL4_9PEZI